VIAFAPGGIADLDENRLQLLLAIETVEETGRVETQSPAAQLGEQTDRAVDIAAERLVQTLAHRFTQ